MFFISGIFGRIFQFIKMTRVRVSEDIKILKYSKYQELLKKIESLEKKVTELEAKVVTQNLWLGSLFNVSLHTNYSGLLKIRTPKNPDFCVFAKQGLSKKSGLLCSRQTGIVLKIRTYNLTDMELFKFFWAEAHFFTSWTLINGFFKRSV